MIDMQPHFMMCNVWLHVCISSPLMSCTFGFSALNPDSGAGRDAGPPSASIPDYKPAYHTTRQSNEDGNVHTCMRVQEDIYKKENNPKCEILYIASERDSICVLTNDMIR
jgi:hypothetical protein